MDAKDSQGKKAFDANNSQVKKAPAAKDSKVKKATDVLKRENEALQAKIGAKEKEEADLRCAIKKTQKK